MQCQLFIFQKTLDLVYGPTTSVYAGRPSNRNNNNNNNNNKILIHDSNINSNRTVYYENGVVLPGSIANLSPQPSPTGSIQANR